LSYSYGSTNNGTVASITNNRAAGRTQNFTYDKLNRVKTAATQATSGAECWGQNFGYDNRANLLSITVSQCSAGTLSVTDTNGDNRFDDTVQFNYDAAGNMTKYGATNYSWNAEDQMSTGAGVSYAYDGDGQLVKEGSTKLYWKDTFGRTLAESDTSGNDTLEMIYFASVEIAERTAPSGPVRYAFADHQETARVMTDANGIIQRDSDFLPFGEERVITGAVAHGHKIGGWKRDSATALDEAPTDVYSNPLGRWMSPRGAGVRGSPRSLNRYAFRNDNPVSSGSTGCGGSQLTPGTGSGGTANDEFFPGDILNTDPVYDPVRFCPGRGILPFGAPSIGLPRGGLDRCFVFFMAVPDIVELFRRPPNQVCSCTPQDSIARNGQCFYIGCSCLPPASPFLRIGPIPSMDLHMKCGNDPALCAARATFERILSGPFGISRWKLLSCVPGVRDF
jgi:hypothetical protein